MATTDETYAALGTSGPTARENERERRVSVCMEVARVEQRTGIRVEPRSLFALCPAPYCTMTCSQLKTPGDDGSMCSRNHSITEGGLGDTSLAGDSMLRSTMT